MAEYDPELRDNTVTEWRTRLLLRQGQWDEAYRLTQRFPDELANTNRWRYWRRAPAAGQTGEQAGGPAL